MEAKQPIEVARSGGQIVLPPGMSYSTAIEALTRKKNEDEKEIEIRHEIACSPLDGLVAFNRVLRRRYGWTTAEGIETIFGKMPPRFIGVETSLGVREQAPYSNLALPGVSGLVTPSIKTRPQAFIITAAILQKDKAEVEAIVAETQEELRTNSIYRGKAIRLSYEYERQGLNYDPISHAPKFMNTAPELENTLIFSKQVMDALTTGIFTPIEYSEACRRNKVPLKRGVLLSGPYGTGKTLTATVTAIKAVRAGWTFVYLDSVLDLARGLEFAARYAPAVIFAEDIDRVLTGERTAAMDSVLNTLDGINTKEQELIAIFTTNHSDQINPAALRMGRIDNFIEVSPPDAVAAQRLATLYGRGLLAPNANLETIGERLAGKIPAFIRETIERAKLQAIARLAGGSIEGEVLESDIVAAADEMEKHHAALDPKKELYRARKPELLLRVPASIGDDEELLGQILDATSN